MAVSRANTSSKAADVAKLLAYY